MKRFGLMFLHWLPLGISIVGICALVYLGLQQNYRNALNDPQVELVESTVALLLSGKQPVEVVPRGSFSDVGKDLTPFIAVYDKDGTPLEASAVIDGLPPKPPVGVFEYAKTNGQNRVTWQPNVATRIAIVVAPVPNATGWFVVAGRNMREGDKRIAGLGNMCLLGGTILLFISFIFSGIAFALKNKFN